MCDRYDTELNNAVKPYHMQIFFDTYADAEAVIYFDPILLFTTIKAAHEKRNKDTDFVTVGAYPINTQI
jgi:hypothetical protein